MTKGKLRKPNTSSQVPLFEHFFAVTEARTKGDWRSAGLVFRDRSLSFGIGACLSG